MPQNIRAFLRKRRRQSNGAEFEKALGSLPANTPVYEYQNVSHIEGTVRSLDHDKIEFCVFNDVPRDIGNRLYEKYVGKTQVYLEIQSIIIRMPTRTHELAASWLQMRIAEKMMEMNMAPTRELWCFRTSTFHGREADQAFLPTQLLPAGRTASWPPVVLEVGKSKTQAKLRQDVDFWLRESNGAVRLAITIKVTRKTAIITSNPQGGVRRTISVKKPHNRGQIKVKDGPLTIPFQGLFLRPPVGGSTRPHFL